MKNNFNHLNSKENSEIISINTSNTNILTPKRSGETISKLLDTESSIQNKPLNIDAAAAISIMINKNDE